MNNVDFCVVDLKLCILSEEKFLKTYLKIYCTATNFYITEANIEARCCTGSAPNSDGNYCLANLERKSHKVPTTVLKLKSQLSSVMNCSL